MARFVFRRFFTTESLTLFIDAQNLYNTVRRAFYSPTDSHVCGQFKPIELANFICGQAPRGINRVINEVRVYSGRPDATKEPKTHAAHMKQCAAWGKAGATVITRQLRYPINWPQEKPQEKGIDVILAIDFISFAVDCVHNVGVIASFDTDLTPALEFVLRRYSSSCKVEVIGINSTQTPKRRLRVDGYSIWCNWIDELAFDTISDATDYNL